MYDWEDILGPIALLISAIGFCILLIAGSYAIVKEANNPVDFKKYEINGNLPTLAIKGF